MSRTRSLESELPDNDHLHHYARIWDLPVRVTHWLLAAAVITSWLTGEQGWMQVHFYSGYLILALILFRILWGFLGPRPARFGAFVTGPRAWWRHLRSLGDRSAPPSAGHNPLGGLMVLFMLGFFLLQPLLGLMSSDDLLTEGPLVAAVPAAWVDQASELHHKLGELVPWVVGIHLAAVVFYVLWKRQNLIAGMVTGRKPVPLDTPSVSDRPWWLPVLLLAICGLLVWGIVAWGRAQSAW